MEVIKTLQPGQHGTKRYQNQYGEQLVCVRYRQDENKKYRYTTVELLISKRPILGGYFPEISPHPNSLVWIKIPFKDIEHRKKIIQMGGQWSNDKKMWKLLCRKVRELGLESRIVTNGH